MMLKSLTGGLFGMLGGGDKPKAPVVPPPAVMPSADDEAIQAAKRRKATEAASRSGRVSTMLSDSSGEKFGG